MKTKIYNNLIFSLLFVCSICGLFGGVGVFAQGSGCPFTTRQQISTFLRGFSILQDVLQKNQDKHEGSWPDNPTSVRIAIDGSVWGPITEDGTETEPLISCADATEIRELFTNISSDSISSPLWEGGNLNIAGPKTFPTTRSSASESIRKGDPATLHLYSSIWGAEKITTTTDNQEKVSGLIQRFFTRFFSVIFTVSGILMVVMLAVHGTQMIYAEFTGNVSGFSDAKKRVKAAAFGTVILLLSWIILDFIDPALLRPKLFETIIQLREIGQGNNLISYDLVVPDGAINPNKNKDTITLTIRACPKLKEGSNFKLQVESIKESLQQGNNSSKLPLEYHYQILHSNLIDNEAFVYDPKEKESILYSSLAGSSQSGDRNNFVGVLDCKKGSVEKVEIPSSDNIIVFPIVSIKTQEGDGEPKKLAKFWRGKPWSYKPKVDADDCITLGKEVINLSKEMSTGPIQGKTVTIDFPTIKTSDSIFSSVEEIVTGYHIENNKVRYCTVKNTSSCLNNGGRYTSASNSKEIKFRMTGNAAGERLVEIDDAVENESIFRITPMLADKGGKKIGQCKEPLRGETACFKVRRRNTGGLFSVVKLPANNCFDTSISRDSAKSQRELSDYARRTVTYSAEVTSAEDVRADSPFPGHSFTYFTFSGLNADDWDEEIWGKNPFHGGGGRGSIVRLTITRGSAFFKHATQDTLVKTANRTNWRGNDIEEVVYFKGSPPNFCITPTVIKGDQEYELENKCHTPPAGQ